MEGATDDGRVQAVPTQRAGECYHQDAAAELLARLQARREGRRALPRLEEQAPGGLVGMALML